MNYSQLFTGLAITFMVLLGIWNFAAPIASDHGVTVPAFNALDNQTGMTNTVNDLAEKIDNAPVSLLGGVDFVVTGLYSFAKGLLNLPKTFNALVDGIVSMVGPFLPSWIIPWIKLLFFITTIIIIVAVLARLFPGVLG